MKYLFLLLFTITLALSNEWIVPESIVGEWESRSEIMHASFKKGDGSTHFPEDSFTVKIIIDSNGNVTGSIGKAQFSDCKCSSNRGWFGRLLNIKTDYIIKGSLVGKIVPEDDQEHRDFTIPFNLVDNRLIGGFMHLQKMTYPNPMFKLQFSRTLHTID